MDKYILLLSAIFAWLAIHSFTTHPLSLALLAKTNSNKIKPVPHASSAKTSSFAIFTCAYNEEAVIESKIKNLLDLRFNNPNVQILVYVDAASDGTAEICNKYKDKISLFVSKDRHGKTYGMNLLVSQSNADILIFTDANVMLASDVLERLEDHFNDPEIGCVCANLNYINPGDSVTAKSGSLYWRIEEGIKRLESLTGGVIGADGSLFAMRRMLHISPPAHIIDDFYLSLKIMCMGYKVKQAKDVKAYEKTVAVATEEFKRKIRISCQAFNVHRMLWPEILKLDAFLIYKYVSHKLLRWFAIFFLVASWILATLALLFGRHWLGCLIVINLPLFIWIFGSIWPLRPISQTYDILLAFIATGFGVIKSMQGKLFQTWTPAASLRK